LPERPTIPAEIARAILVESGHRCAVCGASCPLERAHIIPWHKSKEHRAEDLICLCASCHERADLEKWGEKTLRQHKQKPWVMRQFNNADGAPAGDLELMREKVGYRRLLVTKWREMVEEVASQSDESDRSVTEILERHRDFYSLRPHLSQKTISELCDSRTYIVGNTIATPLSYIIDDIAKVEKKWDLV
jgi:hypothetical protein